MKKGAWAILALFALLTLLPAAFCPSPVSAGDLREEMGQRPSYLDVLSVDSVDYDAKAVQDVWEAYKIPSKMVDSDYMEAERLLHERLRENPPEVILLKPVQIDANHTSVQGFDEIEPFAIRRGETANLHLVYNDLIAISERVYELKLGFEIDDSAKDGVRYDFELLVTGEDYYGDSSGEWLEDITRGPFVETGLEADLDGYSIRFYLKVDEDKMDDDRMGGTYHFFNFHIVGVQTGGGSAGIIDTFASETAGETGVAVPAAIVIGLLGLLAAAAGGAGAAAGGGGGDGSDGSDGEETGSSYKMYLQKDFGNRIRRGGEHVFLYARMAEIKSDGSEMLRPDLTSQIEIFSPDAHLEVGPATLSGDYMGAAVKASYQELGGPEEGVVSFKFTGEGGAFQNNVTFKLVGDARIRIEDVWLLDSEEDTSAELPFRLLDFLSAEEPEVDFAMKEEGLPFALELDYPGGEEGVLKIEKSGSPVRMEELIRGHMGTLTARAGEEKVEETFVVRLCREGLYLDFDLDYGEESSRAELKCYPDEEGEMITNRVGIGILIWDEKDKRPRMLSPEELAVKSEDEKSIGERIGLLWESTGETVAGKKMTDERLSLWQVKARKLLPYLEPVPTKLQVQARNGERKFAEEFAVKLMPDVSAYFDEYERQYEHLKNLGRGAFSKDFADRYERTLSRAYNRFGLADLQLMEKSFRKIAQSELERMAIEQSMVSDNYDQIIGVLEWTAWLGEICTDILLAIFTGPMGAFLVGNAKDLLVETVTVFVERPGLGPLDLLWISGEVFVRNTVGSLDNLMDFPKPEQWSAKELKTYAPKLAVWVSLFFAYRVIFHYYYDQDENKERSLYEAVKAAGWDLTLKATLELFMQEYLSRAGQSDRVFGQEMKGAKEIAAMDADTFTALRDDFINALLEYINQLKAGLSV